MKINKFALLLLLGAAIAPLETFEPTVCNNTCSASLACKKRKSALGMGQCK